MSHDDSCDCSHGRQSRRGQPAHALLVLGGLYAAGNLRQDIYPDTRPETVNVVVEYPGATPAEVEDAIVLPIELAVAEVDYVKRIRSSARESVGSVSVELINESDVDVALEEVKNAVDRIRTFPEEAERPEIMRISRRREVMSVYVYGDTAERALLEIAESVRDDLIVFPEITAVQLSGHRPYEISIEIHEDNLRRYDLTLPEVAEIVREASLDLGGGTIRADGGDVLVRTTEKRYTGADYATVPVFRKPSGETVLLGDIGQVIDGFAPTDQRFLYDGLAGSARAGLSDRTAETGRHRRPGQDVMSTNATADLPASVETLRRCRLVGTDQHATSRCSQRTP